MTSNQKLSAHDRLRSLVESMRRDETVVRVTADFGRELLAEFDGSPAETSREETQGLIEEAQMLFNGILEHLDPTSPRSVQLRDWLRRSTPRLSDETSAPIPRETLQTAYAQGFLDGERYAARVAVEPSGLAAQIEDARKRIEAWPDDVRVAMGLPPKPGPVCGRPTEGHNIGTCTKPYGHKNHCWFPNMWNDM